MSFGRTGDQYAVSGLTSVTPHTLSSIHDPSDRTQIPEDPKRTEDTLQSRWGDKMKASELTQPAFKSLSSGHDGHVNSETVCEVTPQQSEASMSSQGGKETTSEMTLTRTCSSTTGDCEKPAEGHRRRGRPRKMKLWVTKERTDAPRGDALDSNQDSTKIPLATTLENRNSVDLPSAMDGNSISTSPQNKESDLLAVLEDKVEDDISLLPRRKRGRPKREEFTAVSKTVSLSPVASIPASPPHVNNISGSPQRPRSREQCSPTQDEMSESPNKADLVENELTPAVNSNSPNDQGLKRKIYPSQVEQQVPAKMYKLDDSQEAVTLLSNDTAETDKQESVEADKLEADIEGKGGQLSPQPGEGKDQRLNQVAIPHKKRFFKPEVEVTSSDGLSSLNMVSPSQTVEAKINQSVNVEGSEVSQSKAPDSRQSPVDVELLLPEASSADIATSSKETTKSLDPSPQIKDEKTEIEQNTPKPSQNNANTSVKSERLYGQRIIFRRKKGGRRRRKSYVLSPPEDPVSPQEESCDAEQNADGEEVDKDARLDANTKIIYVKTAGKTLLKCGYCDRIFKFMSQFVIHHRIHTGERPFKCNECGRGFSKNSNLNLHLKTHRKSNLYKKCHFCDIKFSSSEYPVHMKGHAIPAVQNYQGTKKEKCTEDSCKNDQKLKRATSSPSRVRKVCQYCGKSFQFQSALIRHVRVHTGEKPYKCDICGKAFGQAYFLRVHELTHWSVKRYNCTRCQKSFTHYSNAKNHTCRKEGEHYGNPTICLKPALTYTCHICKNVYDHLQEFNRHMRTHMGAKLYRCLYCDKLFGVLSEFTAHQKQCRAEKKNGITDIKEEETMSLIQYTVPALRCSSEHIAAFTRAVDYDMRKKRLQTSSTRSPAYTEKPFQSTIIPAHPLSYLVSKLNKLDNRSDPRKYLCPSCGRLFRHMGRLRAHMLTHAPGQSYPCACCGKMLANWKKLWLHQRTHRQRQGRFSCSQCGLGFRFVGPYKKHIREHGESQWVQVRPRKVSLPYQCDQCQISFKTLDQLFSHQLHHSTTPDVGKDSSFDLFVEVTSVQQHNKALNPPINNIATPHAPPEEKSSLNTSAKHPDSAAQSLPLIISVRSQSLNLGDSLKNLNKTPSIPIREESLVRRNENAPITPLRNVKQAIQITSSKSEEGSSNSVSCTVCGSKFPAISDLYQHYLHHARGLV